MYSGKHRNHQTLSHGPVTCIILDLTAQFRSIHAQSADNNNTSRATRSDQTLQNNLTHVPSDKNVSLKLNVFSKDTNFTFNLIHSKMTTKDKRAEFLHVKATRVTEEAAPTPFLLSFL